MPLRLRVDCPGCGARLVRKPGGRCPSCGAGVADHVERARAREDRIERILPKLDEMGLRTGVLLEGMVAAARAAQEVLGRPLGSHVLTAGPVDWHQG